MATSYYSTGTVSLTNGSAVVTGAGTLWQTALIAAGDIYVEAPGGNVLPILSVDSETQITAELKWMGASGTYNYAIERKRADAENLDKNSENLSYLISELRNGTLFKYDASGDLTGRGLYDTKPKGFGYLVTIGVTEPEFYVKGSNADGDWDGPFSYGQGPIGEQGPIGTLTPRGSYDAGTLYQPNDNVLYNGSSFVALQATTGNAPPTLPTTENAYWSLLAVKGQDGAGIGDMVKATYDPQNKQADAFDRGNHTGDLPDTASFADPAAPTKKVRLDAGAVTAGQTRVLSMPDKDIDLADYFRSGVVVGSAQAVYSTYFGSADTIPSDDTIPQSNEGSGILSLSYTPKSATNKLRVRATVQCSTDALRNVIAALFVGAGASAVKAGYMVGGGSGYHINIHIEHEMLAGTTAPVDVVVRAGPGSGGICYFNGLPSGRLMGGASSCSLTVEEIRQ